MIYVDWHWSQCPVRTCLWEGCQSWAHNSAQGTPRCSKERWGQQEGAKRHTRSLKTQISKYLWTYHMNGLFESSDLYISISEKPVSQWVFQSTTWSILSKSTQLLLSPCSSHWLEWGQSAPCLGGATLANRSTLANQIDTDETRMIWCHQAAGHSEGLRFHGLHDSLIKVSTNAHASEMLKHASTWRDCCNIQYLCIHIHTYMYIHTVTLKHVVTCCNGLSGGKSSHYKSPEPALKIGNRATTVSCTDLENWQYSLIL